LIARVCVGDSDGLGLLFSRYARLVWTVARRILRNNEEADDLLQDVFLLVRRKATDFDGSNGTIRSFIVHITYQRAISRRRYLMTRHFYSSNDSEKDATDWNLQVMQYVQDNLGPAYFARVNTGSGLTGFLRGAANLRFRICWKAQTFD